MLALLVLLLGSGPTPTPTRPAEVSGVRFQKAAEAAPQGGSLAEVARRITLRLPPNQRTIDNDAVRRLSEGVELTMAKPASGAGSTSGGSALPADKALWQERYRSATARVAQLRDEVSRLERQEYELSQQFYSWSDATYRDSVIKPKWDQTKSALAAARTALADAEKEPDAVLEAAHRAGAQPGWFRGLPEAKGGAAGSQGGHGTRGPVATPRS